MKKTYIMLVLLGAIALIAGCSSSDKTAAKTAENAIACEKPYIIVNGDCCLDNNNNGLCDKNEAAKKPGDDLLQGPYVSERCEGGGRLKCVTYNIGLNTISIKFQSTSKDLINIKKIELPSLGCSREYGGNVEMRYDEVQELNIPCNIRHTTIDSDMVITTNIRVVKLKNTGEVYDVSEPSEAIMNGHISGAVKV
jgi:hypothetical protein